MKFNFRTEFELSNSKLFDAMMVFLFTYRCQGLAINKQNFEKFLKLKLSECGANFEVNTAKLDLNLFRNEVISLLGKWYKISF